MRHTEAPRVSIGGSSTLISLYDLLSVRVKAQDADDQGPQGLRSLPSIETLGKALTHPPKRRWDRFQPHVSLNWMIDQLESRIPGL